MTTSNEKKGNALWNIIKKNWMLGLMIGLGVLLIAGGIAATVVGAAAYGAPAAFGLLAILAGLTIIGTTVGYTVFRYRKRRKIEKWAKGKVADIAETETEMKTETQGESELDVFARSMSFKDTSFQVTEELKNDSHRPHARHLSQQATPTSEQSTDMQPLPNTGVFRNILSGLSGLFARRKAKKISKKIQPPSTPTPTSKKDL